MTAADEVREWLPGGPPTQVFGPVGSVVSAERIDGDVHQHQHQHLYGRLALTTALDRTSLARLRKIFVRPDSWDAMVAELRARRPVALVAEPGTGRRITAVNLLAELHVPVKEILLPDGDELDRHFTAAQGTGYLLVAPSGAMSATTAGQLNGYLAEVVRAQSFVVITATAPAARDLDLERRAHVVRLRPAHGLAVFRQALDGPLDRAAVDGWSREPRITECLAGAAPADAFRLASLVIDVVAGNHGGDDVTEVLAAYGDWEEDLRKWDQAAGEEEDAADRRATLLAVAALETAPAEVIFQAARRLMSVAGLDRPEGSGLAGPGVEEKLGQVGAVVDPRSGVTFNRTDYARAVLDRVWTDRPHLRPTLTGWLTSVHEDVPAADGERAATALLELAERHGAADPVFRLATGWAAKGRGAQAAPILSTAALSLTIGRATRRRLYEWATTPSAATDLQLLVVHVCAGELAVSYPGISLTRLRHLANRDVPEVRRAVVDAVHGLAAGDRMDFQLEREVSRWVSAGEPARALTGLQAFLALARLRAPAGRVLILSRALGRDGTDILSECWREAFRDGRTRHEADAAAATWLDAALHGQEPRDLVVRVLTGACRKSADAALMAPMIVEWHRRDAGPGAPDRSQVQAELFEALFRNDGLTPGGSTGPSPSGGG